MKAQEHDGRYTAATITAIVALFVGFGLTIAGFVVPPLGEIHNTVLWVLGQVLIYAASIFGVSQYFNTRLQGFQTETRKFIDEMQRSQPGGNESNS